MIQNVSPFAGASPAATNAGPAAGATRTLHTPFGDVILDTIAGTGAGAGGGQPASAPVVVHTAPTAAADPKPPAAAPVAAPAATVAPTIESTFGQQAYLDKPSGTGPLGPYDYNPIYFATRDTANKVASLVGGTVVEKNDMVTGGPFQQSAPNEMIQFAGGRQVNAGLIANFYNHGYPQSYIDMLLKQVADGTAI
jgi:hypothetical protein